MATDDLIAALQGVGRVDSQGNFSLDREKAREKLRTFQVAEPQRHVLHFVALAVLKRATKIEVVCDSDDLIVRFDGVPITREDLDDLYNSSFAASRDDEQRARQQLAVGIHAALALNPRYVRVVSGEGKAAVSLLARHDHDDVIELAKDARGGTQIHVKQRFRPGLVVRFVRHLSGGLAEATWLRKRACYSTLPITLNGETTSSGLQLPGASHSRTGEDGPCRGVAGWLPSEDEGVVRLVRHGVWICDEVWAWLPRGVVVVVANDRLLTDLSGDKVVQDEEHARCLALARELAGRVIGDAIGPGETVELDASWHERLQRIWEGWDGALRPRTTIGAAMTRVVAWPDIWGRRHTFAALVAEAERLGHIPASGGDFAAHLPATEEIIVKLGDPFIEEVLALGFPGQILDITDQLERRKRTEANRRRWRAQPCESTLTAANYVMLADFSIQSGDRRIQGQAGLRRAPSERCSLRVIVEGCALTEIELDAAIAGVDAVISGPLRISPDFSGPERDELFAACLAGWVTAGRLLAEKALRDQVIGWPAGPARVALLQGLLRAYHPREVLLRLLAAAGYDDKGYAEHAKLLLRDMATVEVPKDLPEQPWMRDSFQFRTASGPLLSVGAVAVGLSQGLPLSWVPDELPGHAALRTPVLRLTPHERDLVRWLFAGRLPRLADDVYMHLFGEAEFLGQPELPFRIDPEQFTPTLFVETGAGPIGMAFPRDSEGWQQASSRTTCEVFRAGRLLAYAKIWSPVFGARFVIVGDRLTPKPSWDAVVLDDAFHAAAAGVAAAVPALLRVVIERAPAEVDLEAQEAWYRGLLSALIASFPSLALREAYSYLLTRKGREPAEQQYLELLALAAVGGADALSRVIKTAKNDFAVLMDVPWLAARVAVSRPTPAQVEAVGRVLREIRGVFGQDGGGSWLTDVGCCSDEVGALPMFRRVDGVRVTLAEVGAQARTDKVHVLVTSGRERPPGFLTALRVDALCYEQLKCLFGPGALSTEARDRPITDDKPAAPRPEPPRPQPAPKRPAPVEVLEDPPPTADDLASLFTDLQREADKKIPTVTAAPALSPIKSQQSTPQPPSPAERLVARVEAELNALRRGHESLLTGFNLDQVRAVTGTGAGMVRIVPDGLVIDLAHPLVKRALEQHSADRLWISFLASQIYTALNVWREDITDIDEAKFHARHLAWLCEQL